MQSEQPILPSPELPKSYKDLRNHALACTRCGLAESRKSVVFSDGVEDASVMVVGEAPNEIKSCSPFLTRQIQLIQPKALLAVGSFAGRLLTGQEKTALGRIRGEVHSYQGVPLIVTYHPAALLRNPKWTFALWEDLQLLRQVLNSG